jgi:hypothetical protein
VAHVNDGPPSDALVRCGVNGRGASYEFPAAIHALNVMGTPATNRQIRRARAVCRRWSAHPIRHRN